VSQQVLVRSDHHNQLLQRHSLQLEVRKRERELVTARLLQHLRNVTDGSAHSRERDLLTPSVHERQCDQPTLRTAEWRQHPSNSAREWRAKSCDVLCYMPFKATLVEISDSTILSCLLEFGRW
jgi:hypothetical protein